MSRVGKNSIIVSDAVKIVLTDADIEAKGKIGSGRYIFSDLVNVSFDGEKIKVAPVNDSKQALAMWGTTQRQIQNLIKGVSEGCVVNLELNGVGYRAAVQNNKLTLQLGYSHDVVFDIPEGVTIKCEKPTAIVITGACKQTVGQVAAEIRRHRLPEPYKGKGVIREKEFIVRKEGKKK